MNDFVGLVGANGVVDGSDRCVLVGAERGSVRGRYGILAALNARVHLTTTRRMLFAVVMLLLALLVLSCCRHVVSLAEVSPHKVRDWNDYVSQVARILVVARVRQVHVLVDMLLLLLLWMLLACLFMFLVVVVATWLVLGGVEAHVGRVHGAAGGGGDGGGVRRQRRGGL